MRIYKIGELILRKVCEPVKVVDDTTAAIVKEMIELMIADNGLGLAANQVGLGVRIFVCDIKSAYFKDRPLVAINPKIEKTKDKEALGIEGCLSIPGHQFLVKRAKRIKLTALDDKGIPYEEEFINADARAIQHEYDHLNGILCLDRATNKPRQLQALAKPLK